MCLYVFLYPGVCLSVCIGVCHHVFPFLLFFFGLPICLSMCVWIFVCLCVCAHLCTSMSVYCCVYVFLSLCFCVSVCLCLCVLQRNLTELVVAVDVNNLLHLYASMLFERRILVSSSKLSTVRSSSSSLMWLNLIGCDSVQHLMIGCDIILCWLFALTMLRVCCAYSVYKMLTGSDDVHYLLIGCNGVRKALSGPQWC